MTTVLETLDLRREFGELVAVDDVSLAIESGEITSIIGPNGAGKTTFYNLLTGTLKPTAGEVWLRQEDDLVEITGQSPHEIATLGLSRSYQITNVFEGLTVRENVQVARISKEGRSLDFRTRVRDDEELRAKADEVLGLANLTSIATTTCSALSHGQKRNVEIAITLAIDPSVVLLDEPTAGMNPAETEQTVELIRDLDTNTGTTFVLTEHDMDVVVDISDRIIVFHEGRVIADGTPTAVMADDQVTEAYLGGGA